MNAYPQRMDDEAARDLAAVAKRAPDHNPVKTDRDSRDNRDAAPDNGSSVPVAPDPNRDNRDNLPRFELVEGHGDRKPGVYWHDAPKEPGSEAPPAAWICAPLRVVAMTRDAAGCEWGRLLKFHDADGRAHSWACPQSLHAGNGDELRAVLLREGLTITTSARLRRLVGDYIQQAHPDIHARCVSRTGWHDGVFVLPRESFGDTDAAPVLFQAMAPDSVNLGQGGTREGWITEVAAPCAGNSRLVLAVCMAFAAPCVGLLQAEGGGVHLRGSSSTGKSTAQHVAASVYGPPAYKQGWRATDNGLEGSAALHSDMLLVLDEIGELDAKDAGKVAYMLANGQGKARSQRDGTPRAIATWRLLFLSSGEVGLGDLVTQSGGRIHAGQEVRVIDLPADAGAGFGLFERVPDGMTPGQFADTLKAAAATHYGHALPAFLNALVANPAKARETLGALRASIAASLTAPDAPGQVRRVADRFALVGAAGELATVCGLTGWTTGEAERAATACFNAWQGARDTKGNAEPAAMLAQVRGFLEANGEARFTDWNAGPSAPRTINRAGFRKEGGGNGPAYYIERECFRREVCRGFDYQAVARVLAEAGALLTGSGEETTRKERLPDGRRTRVYVVTPALWADA